jgi:hypothetical protein
VELLLVDPELMVESRAARWEGAQCIRARLDMVVS